MTTATNDAAVHHATFTIERDFAAKPSRVWGAFADEGLKARWFGQNDAYTIVERAFDFRAGGRERLVGHWKSGMVSDFRCQYFDILDGRRITYVYEMVIDDWKMSVSLATIEVEPHGDGTRLTITEQGAFYGEEGAKNAVGREQGTRFIIDGLAASLADEQ